MTEKHLELPRPVERRPHERLSVLWLSHFVPYPPKGGCFQRSYNLIAQVGHEHDVHLIAMRHKRGLHPESELRDAAAALSEHCRSVKFIDVSARTQPIALVTLGLAGLARADALTVSVYRSAAMRLAIRQAIHDAAPDVVHFDTISLAQYRDEVKGCSTVLTHHGAESFMIRRRIRRERNPLKKLFFVREWLALRRYERRMCHRFDVNVVMSELDQRILESTVYPARFVVVGNGVDTHYFKPVNGSSRRTLIFAGRLDQHANRDGILYFMRDVWPRVKSAYPDAVMHIVGNNPPKALQRLAESDTAVRLHGFVPDVRPYFSEARAAVCPIRDGGGTRIKVLDALAQGVPLVSTTIGTEGLELEPERHFLVADSTDAFVAQISRLFEHAALGRRLADEGRRLIEQQYAWEVQGEKLKAVYGSLASAPAGIPAVQIVAS
jgi:glycosyltransferase involved in cell wall biosynthesis